MSDKDVMDKIGEKIMKNNNYSDNTQVVKLDKYSELDDHELEIVAGGAPTSVYRIDRLDSSIETNQGVERCFYNICVVK